MIRVAFTGTRRGMSKRQREQVRYTLEVLGVPPGFELHHGDCVGADQDVHGIAQELAELDGLIVRIVVHPPRNPRLRAYLDGDEHRDALPYLERNRALVDECDCLLACPFEDREQPRGGTWSTVRYARRKLGCRHVAVIKPTNRPGGGI